MMLVKFNQSFRHWQRGRVYNLADGQANLLIHRTIAEEVVERARSKRQRAATRRANNSSRD
ncbi:MAG TPA: hypothetical protein VLA24_05360 [Pseudomonadales bacterium]|nr:hypothetical protein [Pseudomonadales bacterium]